MLKIGLCLLQVFVVFGYAVAQVQTPRFTSMNPNTNGYYEYLPEGYSSGTQTYPLILSLHGSADLGNGTTDLPKVLNAGLPHVISVDSFPASFTVNGQTHRFIVISPQFVNWPSALDVRDVLDYIISHYRVNLNRIYVTGLSMGGGVTWEFAGLNGANASKIAAIVPVCGASWPDPPRAYTIGDGDVAVWATHNDADPLVDVWRTNEYVSLINSRNPTPTAKKTIFRSSSHDSWTTTYDPLFEENGMNIYEWMLQYQRAIVPLPVSIINYKAEKSGNRALISWTTTYESNNHHFTIERSSNGRDFQVLGIVQALNRNTTYSYTDDHPLPNNYYRLSQTDINGRTTYFETLQVNMSAITARLSVTPNPATDRITLRLNGEESGAMQAVLVHPGGAVIRRWNLNKSNRQFTEDFSLEDLPSGTYFLRVTHRDFTETRKLIKN